MTATYIHRHDHVSLNAVFAINIYNVTIFGYMRAIDVHDLLGAPLAFDTSRNYVTSPWFSTKTLAAIRGAIALYTFVTLLFILIWEAVVLNDASSYFSYFTELTYIGICSYYWASFTQTFAYARQLQHSSDKLPEYPLQKWPRILQLLHVMLQTTIITFPILVTIVYWALLASSSVFDTPFSAWSNLSLHVFNTIWSLFEMFGTNSPPPRWWMLPFMIIILALYLGVAYITFDTQGFYPYPFLDPTTQHTFLAAYIVGIALAACIVFSLAKTMMWTRMKFASGNKQVTVPKLTQEENVEISRMEEEGERLV